MPTDNNPFIFDAGILKPNPNYQPTQTDNKKASTMMNSEKKLVIVTRPEDLMAAQTVAGGTVPKAVENAIVSIQDQKYIDGFNAGNNVDPSTVLEGLKEIFYQNEIPLGLMSKLITLKDYELNFMVDNSTSMRSPSPMGRQEASIYLQGVGDKQSPMLTRWEEAEDRLHVLIDLIGYVPTGPITISFFNENKEFVLNREGKTPQQFTQESHQCIRSAFSKKPSLGNTPLLNNMKTMLQRHSKLNTLHYVLTDGEPSGGANEIHQIKDFLLYERGKNISQHPFSFLGCSNREEDMMWMREIEDIAPYVAAVDDFSGERREVYFDQGPAFPYSRGFWWLCNLTAALNPDDLDALDQHAPLTKSTLDNLLGRTHSEVEYRLYFESHPHAKQLFAPDYQQFLSQTVARNIQSVARFRQVFAAQLNNDINRGDDETESVAERIAAQTIISEFGGNRFFIPVQRGVISATSSTIYGTGNTQNMWSRSMQSTNMNYNQFDSKRDQACPCVLQ